MKKGLVPIRRRCSAARGAETTRQRILRVARKLVRERGHLDFSLREAARAVGLSAPSMYGHFLSRADLVQAIGNDVRRELRMVVAAVAAAHRAACSRIVEMGMAYLLFAVRNREEFLLAFVDSRESLRSLTPGLPEESIFMLGVKAIAEGLASGELVDQQELGPIGIAYAIWAAAHGMAILRLTYLSAFEVDFEATSRVCLTAIVSGWSRRP